MQFNKKYVLFIVMFAMLLAFTGGVSAADIQNDAASGTADGSADTLDDQASGAAIDGNNKADVKKSNSDNLLSSGKATAKDEHAETQQATENNEKTIKTDNADGNSLAEKTIKSNKTLKAAAQEVTVSDYDGLLDAISKSTDENLVVNLATGTYTATGTVLDFGSAANITINGNNSIINGKNSFQFMDIPSEVAVGLNNLTITNCTSTFGGAIDSRGTLIISGTNFTGNWATTGGAAIRNRGNLSITNAGFMDNAGGNYGGAIYNDGILNITNTLFLNNSASRYGGAIYNRDTLKIENATFQNNSVSSFGGAIGNYGTSTIANNTFASNNATHGGAIYNNGGCTLNVADSSFSNNNATNGGAIRNYGTLNITGSAFTGNNATNGGALENAGNSNITNTEFAANRAADGGLLYVEGGSVVLSSSRIENNTAAGGYIVAAPGGTLTASGNIFANNTNTNNEDILFSHDAEGFNDNITAINNVYANNSLYVNKFDASYNISSDVVISADLGIAGVYNDTISSGTITVSINGVEYPTAFSLTQSNITISLPTGSFEGKENSVALSYAPLDDSYQRRTLELTVSFNRTALNVIVPSAMQAGNAYDINITLYDLETNKPMPDQYISITIGDKTEMQKTDENGRYTYEYLADVQDNEITVEYAGLNQYLKSSTTRQLNVELTGTTLAIKNKVNVELGETVEINVTLEDAYGNPLADKEINVAIDNFMETVTTGENGAATLTYTKTSGRTQQIIAAFNGDDEYAGSTNTSMLAIGKIATSIVLDNATAAYGDSFTLKAVITDADGNPVNGGKVAFKLNGKTIRDAEGNVIYGYVANGIAQITVDNLYDAKSYVLSAVYGGTDAYESIRAYNSTLTVTKANATMAITPNAYTTQTNGTMTATVTINRGSIPVTGGKVALKINGVSLRDSNGNIIYGHVEDGQSVMTFKIPSNLKTGICNLTAVYGGKNYNRCEASAIIAITKPWA